MRVCAPLGACVLWGEAVCAAVLGFDDLAAGAVPSGYGGLQWHNFYAIDGLSLPPEFGYHAGTVSPSNVIYNLSGDPAWIRAITHRFDLKSAYLTAGSNSDDELHVQVQGWVGSTPTYDNTYRVTRRAPTLINLNYEGVDQVKFVSSVPIPFAMDDVTVAPGGPLAIVGIEVNVAETAEPSPYAPPVRLGELTITRRAETNAHFWIFLEVTGTATFGEDYWSFPQMIACRRVKLPGAACL